MLTGWVESIKSGGAVRAAAMAVLPASHVPKRIVVTSLPRNTNGKLDRTQIDVLPDSNRGWRHRSFGD